MQVDDLTEIAALRVGPCRYCHGVDHNFQWENPHEIELQIKVMEKTQEMAASGTIKMSDVSNLIPPSDEGGYGYSKLDQPHPECPECDGFGKPWIDIKDRTKVEEKANGDIEVRRRVTTQVPLTLRYTLGGMRGATS